MKIFVILMSDRSVEAVQSCEEEERGCEAELLPAGRWENLVTILAAAEADVDLHVYLLHGPSLVDDIHGLKVGVTAVVMLVHGLGTATEYQLWTSSLSVSQSCHPLVTCHLTGLLKSSCDVEAALDPDRADPDEGVGRGLVEGVVLRAGVIISLVSSLHTIATVHIIVGTHLEQHHTLTPSHHHIQPSILRSLPWETHRRYTLTVHQPEILTDQG